MQALKVSVMINDFIITAITVRFSQSAYRTNEGSQLVQPILLLNSTSSYDIFVKVKTKDNNNATGEWTQYFYK